jgi:hypothetical protein
MSETEKIDPWTDGLRMNYPAIYNRLEKFLDMCAEAAGRDRHAQPQPEEHKSFKTWDFNPSKHDDWMKKMHARHDQQKKATDARNLKILQKLIEKRISISTALRQNGMTSLKSLESTLKASHDRGGFGENDWMYDRFKQMKMQGLLKPDAKGKKATVIVFDGRNFVERKQ